MYLLTQHPRQNRLSDLAAGVGEAVVGFQGEADERYGCCYQSRRSNLSYTLCEPIQNQM